MDDIEERLRSHAQAFDGLLSLIPAKYYYGEDGSDQWKRKKQTKEQAREAKRAKLDPDSSKTVKDVMDENARKRKRAEEGRQNDADSSDGDELGSELPREGLKRAEITSKKQKQSERSTNTDDPAEKASKSEEAEARKKLKEEKKAQKKLNQKEKKKAKEATKKAKQEEQRSNENKSAAPEASSNPESKPTKSKNNEKVSKEESLDEVDDDDAVAEGFSLEFTAEQEEDHSSSISAPNSPGFDASNTQSGSSSISSIAPPSAASDATKNSTSELKPLKPTSDELRQRLQKRLDALRAARHADGLNGKPAKNRQELIEARRQKAEQRKAHKKLLRQNAKEEEQRLKDEAMARRFSPGGSGSLLASPRSPVDSMGSGNNYAFGRVVFADGQVADPTLSNLRDQHESRGPRDPASALKVVEAKKARLSGMTEEQRADIEEKDMWLNAKKRAHGDRVRDDTSLLKKALKRKETAKKKSEREWKDRLDAVKKGKEVRQQKREDNLRKRRDEKGSSGKKSGGGKGKPRPGFEGSFKAKVGGKKK